jgi:threonylcarbamoyladenosine tRNA methylthiotransferase MtaB
MAAELLCEAIPRVALTTDIIVGFPGETDVDFECSYEFVKAMGFARIHVFPYSPKEKTPAAEYDAQISPAVKSYRTAKMIALGEQLSQKFLERHIGKELEVLYETAPSPGIYEGYSKNYIAVRTESKINLMNEIQRVKVAYRAGEHVVSEILL